MARNAPVNQLTSGFEFVFINLPHRKCGTKSHNTPMPMRVKVCAKFEGSRFAGNGPKVGLKGQKKTRRWGKTFEHWKNLHVWRVIGTTWSKFPEYDSSANTAGRKPILCIIKAWTVEMYTELFLHQVMYFAFIASQCETFLSFSTVVYVRVFAPLDNSARVFDCKRKVKRNN